MTAPTPADVKQITTIADPVIRNLQITQCYHELSIALARRTGPAANWCTFATWASKQAGQSIRKEDLRRALERALEAPASPQAAGAPAAEAIAAQVQPEGGPAEQQQVRAAMHQALKLQLAVDRVAHAVGRGNHKVFAEIGLEFARFLADFSEDAALDAQKLQRFVDGLRPGKPPEGQEYLRRAFSRYYQAFFEADEKRRAEMLLCANIEIGMHEQTRLQPEIAEALDAAYVNLSGYLRRLLGLIFPFSGWLALTTWAKTLLGRPTSLEQAARLWLAVVQVGMRRVFTDTLMTIRFPPDRLVRLGDDLAIVYPQSLQRLENADLCSLLAQIDPTPDSPSRTGARDWARLPDRLHFIADLFRCYQETPALFEPPFTSQQVNAIKIGSIPKGDL